MSHTMTDRQESTKMSAKKYMSHIMKDTGR